MTPPPLPHTNLFVITLNHENHFYTSPDAPGLLIKFIWAHTDHANKTFQGPGEEWCQCCQNYLQVHSDKSQIENLIIYNVNLCIVVHWQ